MEVEGSANKWIVPIDGSEASHDASSMVIDSLMNSSDQIILSHIYNPEKTYLKFEWKEDQLKKIYEGELLSRLHSSKYELCWEKLKEDKTTKEQIHDIADEKHASVMVVGYHGRKGPKE
jgi:nucleotide-binding universal stress UspA family protein